ncbi:MAG: iron-containing alcohol dehydrogenase [Alicyclobacillus sp.]|nr:iron-containing alcohol dehydrogenase [Alicyclobacillus sp.]
MSGPGASAQLPATVTGLCAKRPLLITDAGLRRAGVVERIERLFAESPVRLAGVFDRVAQDARATLVNEAAAAYAELGADSLVALGGGSVLDTAKGVKWMISKGLRDIREGLGGRLVERWPAAQPMSVPHVALPTTAGTGAEVSPIAVIYHEAAGVKVNILHPYINADVAILDPFLTTGLPPFITAFTGFDALTHAVEAYFSPRSNPITDGLALHAVRLIVENLPLAVHHGGNVAAREQMLLASTMAITAFSGSLHAIPVHNLAHVFGAQFGIPHGLANAVLLPAVMRAMPEFYTSRAAQFAEAVGAPGRSGGLEGLISLLERLRADVGLPQTFHAFTMDPEVLAKMVPLVHQDPAGAALRLPEAVVEQVTRAVC